MAFAAYISHYLHSGHVPFRTLILDGDEHEIVSPTDFHILVQCMFIFLLFICESLILIT